MQGSLGEGGGRRKPDGGSRGGFHIIWWYNDGLYLEKTCSVRIAHRRCGGNEEDRTDDLCVANAASLQSELRSLC